jgi:hypothetical protein
MNRRGDFGAMARLTLTNIQQKHDSLIQRNIKAGLDDYVVHQSDSVFVSAHKKRIVKTENFLEFDNGDFVSAVGTCIYKGFLGQPALKRIYEDFNDDIEALRSNAIGNYLIAVKKRKKVMVFVDKYQVLKTYYSNVDDEWVVANSLADVASVLNNKEVDEFQLINAIFCPKGTITHCTFFRNIFQIFGSEYIEIDLSSGRFSVNAIPYSRKRWNLTNVPIECVVDNYAEIVRNVFGQLAKVFGENIGLQMTGGRDTRTVFAGLMNVGVKPRIMYGVGNSIITNTKNDDLLANEALRDAFDLDLYIMNWRGDDIRNMENWDKFFFRYGFLYSIYGCNENVFAEYEGKIPNYPKLILTGDFCENLKLRRWIEDKDTKHFSIDEFIDGYYLDVVNLDRCYSKSKEFKEYIRKEYLSTANLCGIPNDNGVFHVDQFDELRQITARNADSLYTNFLNEFTHSIAVFSIKDLYEYPFDVPAKYRANGRFQLMLISRLYPDSLKVPFFSHTRKHILDQRTFTLKRKKRKLEGIGYILNKLGINEYNRTRKLLRILYGMSNKEYYKGAKEEAISGKIKESLIEHIYSLHTCNSFKPKCYQGPVNRLMVYAQYLHGINLLY